MRGEVLAGAPQEVRVSFPRERLFAGGVGVVVVVVRGLVRSQLPKRKCNLRSTLPPSPPLSLPSRPEGEKRRDGRGIKKKKGKADTFVAAVTQASAMNKTEEPLFMSHARPFHSHPLNTPPAS